MCQIERCTGKNSVLSSRMFRVGILSRGWLLVDESLKVRFSSEVTRSPHFLIIAKTIINMSTLHLHFNLHSVLIHVYTRIQSSRGYISSSS